MQPNGWALVLTLALAALVTGAGTAQAYVGPGLGAGAVGAVVGVVGAILLALFSIVYYPIKRVLRRRKSTPAPVETPRRA